MRKGWTETTLGEVAERFTGKNTGNIDFVMTVSSKYGLITQEEFFTKRVASNNLGNYTVVEPGSYVFNKSYSAESPLGVIARNNYPTPGLVSPLYIVFKPIRNRIDPNFLSHACDSSIFWNSLRLSLKEGGRAHGALNIKVNDFFNTKILLPPLPEQKRIVDLISSVDSYIYALERQAKSARKSRSAVLHEMLSAGGDGWIDSILGDVLSVSRERVDPSRLSPDLELTHWSIPQLDETGGPIVETASSIGSHKFLVKKDSVVYSLLNPRIPRFAIIDGGAQVVCSTEFAVLEPLPILNLDFLYYFISSTNFQEQVRALAKGTTKSRERIDSKEIAKLQIKLPPLADQKRIVDLVSSMDDGISATERLISETKQLRSGLLSDMLSGEHEIPESYDKVMGAA